MNILSYLILNVKINKIKIVKTNLVEYLNKEINLISFNITFLNYGLQNSKNKRLYNFQ